MVTSFFSRWSKRKLEETTTEHSDRLVDTPVVNELETSQTELAAVESVEHQPDHVIIDETQNQAAEPEEMSVAQLLVSEASESIKKAALRKMFLSEEFNIRDGLDDYDEDYSNLKSLSEGVAATLRDWVKEKTDENQDIEEKVLGDSHLANDEKATEIESEQGVETGEQEIELDIKTVSANSVTSEQALVPNNMGQNIPHKQ